jgi:SPP1 gp7 family putative phage head morphogenesis protein
MALTPLKLITEKASRFVLNSVLFKDLEDRAEFLADSINDTTYLKIAEIVSTNMHLGIPSVSEAIKESDTRAITIARTEAGYITSLGTQMAYNQSEVVEGKIWLTSLDDKVRDEHQINEGEIVGKGEVFPNGEAFPAEHTINCRCTIAPVIK